MQDDRTFGVLIVHFVVGADEPSQIDAANTGGNEQYVFITPKGMDNIHIGNTVRVHRMRDPERSQGTLAFGNSVAA